MAQLNDIEAYKGEAVTLQFAMTSDFTGDITGWSIAFTLKLAATDAVALVSRSAVITGTKTFTVALLKADTNRKARVYQYDVQRVDAGSEAVLSIGSFTILQEVKNA